MFFVVVVVVVVVVVLSFLMICYMHAIVYGSFLVVKTYQTRLCL